MYFADNENQESIVPRKTMQRAASAGIFSGWGQQAAPGPTQPQYVQTPGPTQPQYVQTPVPTQPQYVQQTNNQGQRAWNQTGNQPGNQPLQPGIFGGDQMRNGLILICMILGISLFYTNSRTSSRRFDTTSSPYQIMSSQQPMSAQFQSIPMSAQFQ
eukprot:95294_1